MALPLTEQQIDTILKKFGDQAGKLTKATQDIAATLADTNDSFKKARIEREVERAGKGLGVTLKKADGGLQKFVKALNDQVKSYKNVEDALRSFDSTSRMSRDNFAAASKQFLIASKESGQLQKVLGTSYKEHQAFIENFISSGELTSQQLEKMGGLFSAYGTKFQKSVVESTDAINQLNSAVKNTSIKEALGDSLQKKGGIAGAITESLRGPNGIASFLNFLKAQSAELLIGGVGKAVNQLIEATREYDKSGVAPFLLASGQLVMQVTDLQKMMNDNKETIFAVKGGAQSYVKVLEDLQNQTMKLAGQDPILSGKLGSAAQEFSTQLASGTLGYKQLKDRSEAYIRSLTRMTRVTSMTAEQIVEWDHQIINDSDIREGLAKATASEREHILDNIHARAEELQVMGLSIEKSKQLAVSFEKLRRQATPVQRIKGAAQLGVLAAQVGMSPEDTRRLMILSRKKRNDAEEKEFEKIQMQLGKAYQNRFNQLDEAGNPMADALQQMAGRVEETLPQFKSVFDATRVEGTISGGRARTDQGAQTSLQVSDAVTAAALDAGRIAGWVQKIYEWLSGNGLAGILLGGLGLILSSGLGKVVGLLGTVAEVLIKNGGSAMGGAGSKMGMLGKVAGVVGAAGIGYEIGNLINENTGIQGWIADQVDNVMGLNDKTQQALATTHVNVNKSRAARGLSPTSPGTAPIVAPTAPGAGTDVPSAATTATGPTTDPMQSLVTLQQQAQGMLGQIVKAINTLTETYAETEAQKMQRLLGIPNNATAAARKAQ